ncbi:hypothetical protein BHM03_00027763 [Ensete ventricosum]|nr:hypothetical protein BHM03_00027763 [Ensete ventricosum]
MLLTWQQKKNLNITDLESYATALEELIDVKLGAFEVCMKDKLYALFTEFILGRLESSRMSKHDKSSYRKENPIEKEEQVTNSSCPCMRVDFPIWEDRDPTTWILLVTSALQANHVSDGTCDMLWIYDRPSLGSPDCSSVGRWASTTLGCWPTGGGSYDAVKRVGRAIGDSCWGSVCCASWGMIVKPVVRAIQVISSRTGGWGGSNSVRLTRLRQRLFGNIVDVKGSDLHKQPSRSPNITRVARNVDDPLSGQLSAHYTPTPPVSPIVPISPCRGLLNPGDSGKPRRRRGARTTSFPRPLRRGPTGRNGAEASAAAEGGGIEAPEPSRIEGRPNQAAQGRYPNSNVESLCFGSFLFEVVVSRVLQSSSRTKLELGFCMGWDVELNGDFGTLSRFG